MNLAHNTRKSFKLYLEQKRIEEEKLKMDNEKKEKNKKRTGAEVEIIRKESFFGKYGEKIKEAKNQKKEAQKSSDALLTEAKERLFTVINKVDKEGT